MRKMMKKMSAFFAGVLLVSSLAACASFDHSAYLKAILDNSYHNDSTAFVEQGVGTAEEAAAIYNEGMQANMTAMEVGLSDELMAEFLQFYKDLYNSVKYTVGEAVEVDDNTYEVTVTYERLNVFTVADAEFEVKAAELANTWSEEYLTSGELPSDDEMNAQIYTLYLEILKASLANATYEAPATTVVKVELTDNVWAPNQNDLLALETALFDFPY